MMSGEGVYQDRLRALNSRRVVGGKYVLYWMQASQRTRFNHALEYAVRQARELDKPLLVFFGITETFPEANARHYRFMLEGLRDVENALRGRGIGMVVRRESPELGAIELARDACTLVVDRGYLRTQRRWREHVASRVECPVVQVESDVVVPVEAASGKEEYSAATLRPKIMKLLDQYLVPLEEASPVQRPPELESFEVRDVDRALEGLDMDRSVGAATGFRGGESEASRLLDEFIESRLDRYGDLRNDPTQDYLSGMSPYLHFGQISPVDIALRVIASGSPARHDYLEELIVRRELAANFVYYSTRYDSFDGLPEWARRTLLEHAGDHREYVYMADELEDAKTHDLYWNAAQTEMMVTGKMHGYMRMYWGKKIIEWSATPEEAFRTALYLNNRYELDGRDANGFTGVAWCFGKHDRAWGERPVFGKVRYMGAAGLERKFAMDEYVERVGKLESALMS